MSVLRSKRNISKFEYEHTFSELYVLTEKNIAKIPKRRQKLLCTSIVDRMNAIYRDIMNATEEHHASKADKAVYDAEIAIHAIEQLNQLDKPLNVLWNVTACDTKHMAAWVSAIRKEVYMLNMLHEGENIPCGVTIIDWQVVNRAQFLQKMCELHRYTHGKMINAPAVYANTSGALLISLIDDALYEVILANRRIPQNKREYELRRKHISKAISNLYQVNRPLISLFCRMNYSERVLCEWAELLSSEINLLIALQKSDRKRFGELE